MKYLLDTNFCVSYLRGKKPVVRARVVAKPAADLFLCTPVIAELRFGALWSALPSVEMARTNAFIACFPQLTFDDDATIQYATLRVELSRRGEMISEMDLLIASIALANGLTVVTHNTSEFYRVPGLLVEDWELL